MPAEAKDLAKRFNIEMLLNIRKNLYVFHEPLCSYRLFSVAPIFMIIQDDLLKNTTVTYVHKKLRRI